MLHLYTFHAINNCQEYAFLAVFHDQRLWFQSEHRLLLGGMQPPWQWRSNYLIVLGQERKETHCLVCVCLGNIQVRILNYTVYCRSQRDCSRSVSLSVSLFYFSVCFGCLRNIQARILDYVTYCRLTFFLLTLNSWFAWEGRKYLTFSEESTFGFLCLFMTAHTTKTLLCPISAKPIKYRFQNCPDSTNERNLFTHCL